MHSDDVRKCTVLVVDDEIGAVSVARIALESRGYVVLGAYSGAEALELFTDHHADVDLAVLDYVLPDILGDELLERMSAIDESVVFIAASGYNSDEIPERMLRGTATFIRKPFDPGTLASQIGEAMAAGVRSEA